MSNFDPSFQYFRHASGYRNCRTDHELKFQSFKDFVCNGKHVNRLSESFVIQFVRHLSFEADRKSVLYYTFNPSQGDFAVSDRMPNGFKRANSFKNYKTKEGHPKGLFYELNLYTVDGNSMHHTSRVGGSSYPRGSEHDKDHGTTKGPHWLE